jgi:transposase InsO family protein
MKLNNRKILTILKMKNNGETTYQIKKKVGVTVQRINQILREYETTGEIPIVGASMGRPKKAIPQEWVEIVRKAYKKYRFSASILEPIIERDFNVHIPHNTIHKILLQEKIAKLLNKQIIRKKKIRRYERKHSLSLGHIDWHQRPMDGQWVFGVEDDASRALLSLIESSSPTTELSIQGMEEALQHGHIREVLSDNGGQFTCNHPGHRDSSKFEQYLLKKGIKHIRTKPKHPQSNGKIEKWFHIYEKHRDAFDSKEEFLYWYNHVRPHTSLKFKDLETPWQAFKRKMRKRG